MSEITLESLSGAGFDKDSWPQDLSMPGPENIRSAVIDDKQALYRFQVQEDGAAFAMEVVLDRASAPDPAEGVTFMLNQFAYLWRTDKARVQCAPDGTCRRIFF